MSNTKKQVTTQGATQGASQGASGSAAASPGSTPTQVSTPTARRKRSAVRVDRTGLTPATRARPVYKWKMLLVGIQAHDQDSGWPNLLDQTYVAQLTQCVNDVFALDKARSQAKKSRGDAEAGRSQTNALFDQAVSALGSYYGPTSLELGDFGIKPKRLPHRRKPKKPVAQSGNAGAPAPAGTPEPGGSSSPDPTPAPTPGGAAASEGTDAGAGVSEPPPTPPPTPAATPAVPVAPEPPATPAAPPAPVAPVPTAAPDAAPAPTAPTPTATPGAAPVAPPPPMLRVAPQGAPLAPTGWPPTSTS
jgi:hypothetical protein